MKVGDLVKRIGTARFEAGVVTYRVQKKCWRTDVLGKKVDCNKIDTAPHAVVLIGENYMTIPVVDLELVAAK